MKIEREAWSNNYKYSNKNYQIYSRVFG